MKFKLLLILLIEALAVAVFIFAMIRLVGLFNEAHAQQPLVWFPTPTPRPDMNDTQLRDYLSAMAYAQGSHRVSERCWYYGTETLLLNEYRAPGIWCQSEDWQRWFEWRPQAKRPTATPIPLPTRRRN